MAPGELQYEELQLAFFIVSPIHFVGRAGAPGGIRTPDLLVRSQTLYPAELRAHCGIMYYRLNELKNFPGSHSG
jgi:hypothetical protein